MQKYHRGERLAKAKDLKKARKHYWGYGQNGYEMDNRQLGRVVQYPRSCSCAMCSTGSRIHGNSQAANKPSTVSFWALNPI